MPAIAKKKSTIALNRTRHPLSEANRIEIVRALQPIQTGSLELFLQLKSAHWNVRGASFSSLHEVLESASQSVLNFVDDVAERMAILGGEPLASVQKLAAVPQLADLPVGVRQQEEVIKVACDRIAFFSNLVRDCIDTIERNDDPVSSDCCIRALTDIEKHMWKIESHLNVR
jgi:starvation-inducible DNA-binding protein